MDIIEKGDMNRYSDILFEKTYKPKTFYCFDCGCKFTALKQEYKFILHKFGTYSTCPTCGTSVRYYEPDLLFWP